MKNLLIITSLLFFLALCTGCNDAPTQLSPPARTTIVSAIGDVTDSGLMDETPADIVKFFPLDDEHLYEGFVFRSRVISESDDHDACEYSVKPVSWWACNGNQRIAELRSFKSSVCKTLERMEQEKTPAKKNSLVYEAFVKEATALSQSKSDRKVLVCMSDMLQSTDDFSFYKSNDFEFAKYCPGTVVTRFKRIAPLPNLTGVSIYFLHRCRSYQEQKRYDVAVAIFVALAKEAGATDIHVGPNIIAHE